MDVSTGRVIGTIGASLALLVGVLSAVQSAGYWVITAIRGEPSGWMFIDHAGPAVTSALIAVVMLGIGVAGFVALARSHRSAH